MPEALYFTEDEAANHLLADDPFALLVGFALDQQVTVQQAFLGPLRLKERLGTLEPAAVAEADLEGVLHRADRLDVVLVQIEHRIRLFTLVALAPIWDLLNVDFHRRPF